MALVHHARAQTWGWAGGWYSSCPGDQARWKRGQLTSCKDKAFSFGFQNRVAKLPGCVDPQLNSCLAFLSAFSGVLL